MVREREKKKNAMSLATLSPWLGLITLLLLPLLLLLLQLKKRTRTRGAACLPPSPPMLPIIGNLHQLVGSLPHRSLRALSEKYGPLMLLHLGRVPTLVVSSADGAREILKTHDVTFASRSSLKLAHILTYESSDLGLSPYGEYWRQLRRISAILLLSTKMVQSFRAVREEEVDLMIEKITSLASGVVDMSEVLYSFTNDVVCRAVSGKSFRKEGRNALFRQLIAENSRLLGRFHVEDYIPSLAWLDIFFGFTARAKENFKRWDDVLEAIVKDHEERSRKGRDRQSEDFADVLLSLQKDTNVDFPLTKVQIKALLLDMVGAGSETTYIVLEWALVELIRNSEVMTKLKDEIKRIAGGKAKVRDEDLNQMSYLKYVIKEVLRFHPPTPIFLPRESMYDCQIQRYKVPKQTRVVINAWAIGRDLKSWEAPEEFIPERFISNPVDFKGNDFQFIPFGAGRRMCPGMNFAISTTELALANLIHQFDWDLPNGAVKEDMDMSETLGLTMRRKERLDLLVKPVFTGVS